VVSIHGLRPHSTDATKKPDPALRLRGRRITVDGADSVFHVKHIGDAAPSVECRVAVYRDHGAADLVLRPHGRPSDPALPPAAPRRMTVGCPGGFDGRDPDRRARAG